MYNSVPIGAEVNNRSQIQFLCPMLNFIYISCMLQSVGHTFNSPVFVLTCWNAHRTRTVIFLRHSFGATLNRMLNVET